MRDPNDREDHQPLSGLLLTLAREAPAEVTLDAVISYFGARAFGGVLFLFSIPNLLPLPPGSSTLLAVPLLLIAPQLIFGLRRPWLPRQIAQRRIDRRQLSAICHRVAKGLVRAEGLTRQRLGWLFGRFGDGVIGVVCTGLAGILILPIPLGNMLPAAALATLALSLVQRDGVLALLGYGLSAASVALLAVSGHLVVAAVRQLGAALSLW